MKFDSQWISGRIVDDDDETIIWRPANPPRCWWVQKYGQSEYSQLPLNWLFVRVG